MPDYPACPPAGRCSPAPSACRAAAPAFPPGRSRVLLRQDPRRGSRQGRAALRHSSSSRFRVLMEAACLGSSCLFQVVHQRAVLAVRPHRPSVLRPRAALAQYSSRWARRLPMRMQLDLGTAISFSACTKYRPSAHTALSVQVTTKLEFSPWNRRTRSGWCSGQAGTRWRAIAHRDQIDGHAVCSFMAARSAARRSGTVFILITKALFLSFAGKTSGGDGLLLLLYHSAGKNAMRGGMIRNALRSWGIPPQAHYVRQLPQGDAFAPRRKLCRHL